MDVKRKAFIDRHYWIELLNAREKLVKQPNPHVNHEFQKDGKVIKTGVTDLTIMTKTLEKWQLQYSIYKRNSKGESELLLGLRFVNEFELEMALLNFMYKNLKAISRGESKELLDFNDFGRYEANALLSMVTLGVCFGKNATPEDGVFYYSYAGEISTESYLPTLARYLHRFLEYIRNVLDDSLKDKVKLGVYKIGVCPYQRRKEKECGKVYIGWQYNQVACVPHAHKWQVINSKRKSRLNTENG
jgi:hypothetical protein